MLTFLQRKQSECGCEELRQTGWTDGFSMQAHYDARYMTEQLDDQEQYAAIRVLMQTYLSTMRDIGVQTWLMHGTLLGWWWGKQVSLGRLCLHSNGTKS